MHQGPSAICGSLLDSPFHAPSCMCPMSMGRTSAAIQVSQSSQLTPKSSFLCMHRMVLHPFSAACQSVILLLVALSRTPVVVELTDPLHRSRISVYSALVRDFRGNVVSARSLGFAILQSVMLRPESVPPEVLTKRFTVVGCNTPRTTSSAPLTSLIGIVSFSRHNDETDRVSETLARSMDVSHRSKGSVDSLLNFESSRGRTSSPTAQARTSTFSASVNGRLIAVGRAGLLESESEARSSFQTRKDSWFFMSFAEIPFLKTSSMKNEHATFSQSLTLPCRDNQSCSSLWSSSFRGAIIPERRSSPAENWTVPNRSRWCGKDHVPYGRVWVSVGSQRQCTVVHTMIGAF